MENLICSSNMDSLMPNLPLEIAEQILLRIPARSVVRLKTVCKQWRSLISDPRFLRDHVNLSLLDERNLHHRVVGVTWESSKHSTISSVSIDYPSLNLTEFNFRIESPRYPRILGTCNGLLLLANNEFDKPHLWNPLFREKRKYLPSCKTNTSTYRIHFVGLGYDSSIDDYKVVALGSKILSSGECSAELEGEIYSLKTNSWRTVPCYIPCSEAGAPIFVKQGTHIQGSIYWVFCDNKHILGFDLITEKYKVIDTPPDHLWRFDLVEIRGCLGVFQCAHGDTKAAIWISKDGGWRRLVIFPSEGERFIECLAFINNNEFLLHVSGDSSKELCSKFVIFDLSSMTIRDTQYPADLDWVVHMVETLVSPIGSGDRTQL